MARNKRKWRQFFYEDGTPRRCPHCISPDLKEIVRDSIDVGVGGGGIPCEIETRCNKCNSMLGYWAYGSYDPLFPHGVRRL